MRGQIAVENLAVLAAFIALVIPLAVFLLSTSSLYLSTSSQENAKASLFIIKNAVEEAYAQCPYYREFLVRLGPDFKSIEILNKNPLQPEVRLVAYTDYGEIFVPIAIHNHNPDNVYVYVKGLCLDNAKGNLNMFVKCERVGHSFIVSLGKVGCNEGSG